MNTKKLTFISLVAAVYTVVSLLLAPITYGEMQIRIAEALTMLPLLNKDSIYGVTLGCFLTNLIGALTGLNPTGILDAFIGTLATFIAAYLTYKLRDKKVKTIPVLSILMPVILNFFFVGAELAYLYMSDNFLMGILIMVTSVAAGELISVIVGYLFIPALQKTKLFN